MMIDGSRKHTMKWLVHITYNSGATSTVLTCSPSYDYDFLVGGGGSTMGRDSRLYIFASTLNDFFTPSQ